MKKAIFTLAFILLSVFVYSTTITEKNIELYSNGNVKIKLIKYEDGSKIVKYYETGTIQEIGYFNLNGNKTGHWVSYYEDGKMMAEANFKNDKKTGDWKSYDVNGKMVIYMKYKNGKRIMGCFLNECNELVVR